MNRSDPFCQKVDVWKDTQLNSSPATISKIRHHSMENREILHSCGKKLLTEIVSCPLYLLETCVSIFEADGSCIMSFCNLEWCKYLQTFGIEQFVKDKKRYCQSCKIKMEKKDPVDLECESGISIFSVPIKAGDKIVGKINLGYGNPPKDRDSIKNLAKVYGADEKQLTRLSLSYPKKPRLIIDCAKKNLLSSAKIIGNIVEQKRSQIKSNISKKEIEKMLEDRTEKLSESNKNLMTEINERIKAQNESHQLNLAMGMVFKTAMTLSVSLGQIVDQVVINTSKLLQIPVVALGITENKFFKVTQIIDGKLSHLTMLSVEGHLCEIAYNEKRMVQVTGDLEKIYPVHMKNIKHMKSLTGSPILSNNGKILGSVIVLDKIERNFSECDKYLLEIFTKYIGYEIEKKNMERQLLLSQEMKTLGQLTSGVAHEVRNPLNGILAITEALSNDIGEKAEYSKYIEHIRKQVMRLSDLMKGLLNFGHPIEKANLATVSISKLVYSSVNIWQQSSIFRNHSVLVDVSEIGISAKVYADRAKMEQVLINLLENACAHSCPEKKIKIEVDGDESIIKIKVIDLGTGIKEEHFEHLFEPFFTTRKGGTGLGLGIVKRIVESHNGCIEMCNNSPPPGVCASISLPIIKNSCDSIMEQSCSSSSKA